MTWSVGAGLEGKGVIVTGAAGGIGTAVATAFATTGREGDGGRPRPGQGGRGGRRVSRGRATWA